MAKAKDRKPSSEFPRGKTGGASLTSKPKPVSRPTDPKPYAGMPGGNNAKDVGGKKRGD